MAIEGHLSDMSLASIIQHQCQEMADSQATLEWRGKTGTLYISGGQVIHAAAGTLVGEEAVYEMLRWTDGKFYLAPNGAPPEPTIFKNWNNLLLDGMQRIDEGAPPPAIDRWQQIAHDVHNGPVSGSVVVARDGIILAADMESDPEHEGAVAVFVSNAAGEIGETLALGAFDWGAVTIGQERLLIVDRPSYCVGAVLGDRASPTLIAEEARRILARHDGA